LSYRLAKWFFDLILRYCLPITMNFLESFFRLRENNTTITTEITAGLATFLTMAYIIVINPAILAEAGMDFGAVFVATILAAALGTAIMGLWANWPVALAPGMGLNAFFTYGVVLGMGHSWQLALGAVFWAGLLFFIISLTPLREWVINSLPKSLKLGVGAGIGLFLAVIGLKNAGFVIDDPATLVRLGDVTSLPVLLAALGFISMVVLEAYRVRGTIVFSIIGVSILAALLGVTQFQGVVGSVPSIAPTVFQLDMMGVIEAGMIGVVFAFLFIDFFDTAGTLTSVANLSGKVNKAGKVDGIGRAVLADSSATVAGALFGTSTTTAYIESGAGVKEGGKTGLTAITVAVLFLACLYLAPLAKSIPAFATAPALVFVATFFARNLKDIDWEDVTEYAPALIGTIVMPLTFSITHGLTLAFISYAAIKLLSGRIKELPPAVALVAVLSVLYYALI
jgi:adenine/guanine/hypoxanthine permease